MEERKIKCSICGETYPEFEDVSMGDKHLCYNCGVIHTVVCRRCGKRIWRNDAIDEDLCESCYNEAYVRCCDCGEVILYEDAFYTHDDEDSREYPYCTCCYPSHEADVAIHDYYYKPEPIFYGDGKRFYGIELEIDEGGELESSAQGLLDIANSDCEKIYCKHDGSLDAGFEIVSHPMTLDYHINEMPWEKVMQRAIRSGYLSHQAVTCGWHCHISRSGLGDTYEEQECAIAKILYFYEKFWDEILRFSRRTPGQAERWARRYGGGVDTPKKTLEHAKSSNFGRYMAVNLENANTVEMRIFRGTLKYSTFIATLQFVDEICDVAVSMSDEMLQCMT